MTITKVLIANRGEIAVRIVRACRKLGLKSVVAVSEADRDGLAAHMADASVCVGPASPAGSYLNINALITAAKGVGADAIHPGYGFLAENADFAAACAENGVIFIGATADNILQMGDKLRAREVARRCGVPTVPGTAHLKSCEEAAEAAAGMGYPVLLKAAAGGGGRGIKVVENAAALKDLFNSAAAEARDAFNDDRLYMERYVPRARHIEVQILGDGAGQVIHLGERDCSVQRRKQKLIEETPCTVLPPDLREKICQAAVDLGRFINYRNVGTVEFLADLENGQFYFLEVNTRIQVEHPVTEMTTGVDLVAEGIRLAGGAPFTLKQEDITFRGHAIEFRINAEDPDRNFAPVPGRVGSWSVPHMPGIRIDSHCYPGYLISPYYDSLLAKVIIHGSDRDDALALARFALSRIKVSGVKTTIPFHLSVLSQPDFVNQKIHTQWVEDVLQPAEDTQ